MSLLDCPECWDSPCVCGRMYQNLPMDQLDRLIEMTELSLKIMKQAKQSRMREGKTLIEVFASSPDWTDSADE